MYYPTRWDWATYIGTIGFFLFLLFLFLRVLPMISIFEMRELVHQTSEEDGHGEAHSTANEPHESSQLAAGTEQ
jgi:molybdopterin-containing oxidoreductase family membrane subunit